MGRANLIGIIGQRLLRRLCTKCKKPQQIGDLERRLLKLDANDNQTQIYEAVGCKKCYGLGYKGRTSILEILQASDNLSRLISENASAHRLKHAAAEEGFKTLADDACRRVIDGTTSLDEITRIVDLTDRLEG